MKIARRFAKRTKKSSNKIKGCISTSNDRSVTVKLSGDIAPYRKGQRVVVGIPYRRKTALGNSFEVAEVVAHGEIVKISQNEVTIQSKRTNPIISKTALLENEGKERVMVVENID